MESNNPNSGRPPQNSPEHMAMMRSKITPESRAGLDRVRKAAERVAALEARLAQANKRLAAAQAAYESKMNKRRPDNDLEQRAMELLLQLLEKAQQAKTT